MTDLERFEAGFERRLRAFAADVPVAPIDAEVVAGRVVKPRRVPSDVGSRCWPRRCSSPSSSPRSCSQVGRPGHRRSSRCPAQPSPGHSSGDLTGT